MEKMGEVGNGEKVCEWTTPSGRTREEVASTLARFLGPEYISYRVGEGQAQFAYIEAGELVSLANQIFGFDGWTVGPSNYVTDYAEKDEKTSKWNIGVACTVRVEVFLTRGGEKNTIFRQDIGYGTIRNSPDRGKAMEKCRKEATTDGMKRALRLFGNATGGSIYNKLYLALVKKVKGPADRIEFVDDDLLRKPVNERKRFLEGEERKLAKRLKAGEDQRDEEEYGMADDEMWATVAEAQLGDEIL